MLRAQKDGITTTENENGKGTEEWKMSHIIYITYFHQRNVFLTRFFVFFLIISHIDSYYIVNNVVYLEERTTNTLVSDYSSYSRTRSVVGC